MGLMDLVTDTLNATSNIVFIVQLTASMWIVIAGICAKGIYFRKGLMSDLKQLQVSMVTAHLGGALR